MAAKKALVLDDSTISEYKVKCVKYYKEGQCKYAHFIRSFRALCINTNNCPLLISLDKWCHEIGLDGLRHTRCENCKRK